MSTTPKLISLQSNSGGRFHVDPTFGGVGIAVFGFDHPAGGKVVTLSIDDPEGSAFFAASGGKVAKTVTVPKAKDRVGDGEIQVSASFRIPKCRSEHQITLKGKCGGVELSKVVTVFP